MRAVSQSRSALSKVEGHVVVVGGGFAGLAAARTLQEKSNAKVTLLEASTAVGGRAKSTLLPDGQKVELGATWLHGIEGHPLYNLAIQYGLMAPHTKKGTDFWRGSEFVRQGEANVLGVDDSRKASNTVSMFAETVDECTAQEPPAASLGQCLRKKFQQLYDQTKEGSRDRELLVDTWGWREVLQRAIDGNDTSDDASAAGLAEYEELPGAWPPAVAERMASELSNVRLQSIVSKIKWGQDGAEVVLSDGQVLKADAVIVTVSLGVLKEQHRTLFDPPLDKAKQGAIERLNIGIVDKLFLTFTGEEDVAKTQKQYQLLWRQNSADMLPGGPVESCSAISHCISPPTNDATSRAWTEGVYSLRLGGSEFIKGNTPVGKAKVADQPLTDTCHMSHGLGYSSKPEQRSAVAWISGLDAVRMEMASDGEVKDELLKLLDRFPAIKLPRSFKITRSFWGTDPLARGSYSYVSCSATTDDVSILGEPVCVDGDPVPRPVICIAGEATSRKHIGTTAGAYFSGVREAERIIDSFGFAKKQAASRSALPLLCLDP